METKLKSLAGFVSLCCLAHLFRFLPHFNIFLSLFIVFYLPFLVFAVVTCMSYCLFQGFLHVHVRRVITCIVFTHFFTARCPPFVVCVRFFYFLFFGLVSELCQGKGVVVSFFSWLNFCLKVPIYLQMQSIQLFYFV